MLEELIRKLEGINDPRQSWKVKHKVMDIIMIVFFAMLARADEWEEIQCFAVMNEEMLRTYLELPNGECPTALIKRNQPEQTAIHLWFGAADNGILHTRSGCKHRQTLGLPL